MEMRRLGKDDFDELLSVLNKTFSNKNGREVDFLNEQPKMWERDDLRMNRHLAIFEDGKMVAVAGMYPLRIKIGDTSLLYFTTGNVATLPEYEGRGYFTKIFSAIMDELEAVGADGARLGGARQRYARYGFQPGGSAYKMGFNASNRIKHFGDGGQDVSFEEIMPDDKDALDFCYGLTKKSKIYVERDKEDFYRDEYLAMRTKHCAPYLARRGGEPIGYLCAHADGQFIGKSVMGRNILEMKSVTTDDYIDMLCAWQRLVDTTVVLNIAPHMTEVLARLLPGVESYHIYSPSHFKVMNYEKLIGALMSIKDKGSMIHGESVIEIEGYGRLKLFVNDDGCGCIRTDEEPRLVMDRGTATRVLLGPAPALEISGKDPLLESWLPLPMSWDTLDYT